MSTQYPTWDGGARQTMVQYMGMDLSLEDQIDIQNAWTSNYILLVNSKTWTHAIFGGPKPKPMDCTDLPIWAANGYRRMWKTLDVRFGKDTMDDKSRWLQFTPSMQNWNEMASRYEDVIAVEPSSRRRPLVHILFQVAKDVLGHVNIPTFL